MIVEKDKSWRRHFTWERWSLEHPSPGRFARGPWISRTGSGAHLLFLLYRLLLAAIFTLFTVWSFILEMHSGKWFIYLTHWGFLTCWAQSVLGVCIVCHAYRKSKCAGLNTSSKELSITPGPEDTEPGRMPLLYKVYWVAYNIATPLAFLITVLYWTLLHNPNKDEVDGEGNTFMTYIMHAVNSALCFVDLSLGGPPSRLLHVLQPNLFAVVYVSFNVIYWSAGGLGQFDNHYVYHVLDWRDKPALGAGVVVGSCLLMTLLHGVVCLLAGVRRCCVRALRRTTGDGDGSCTHPSLPLPALETGTVNKAYVD